MGPGTASEKLALNLISFVLMLTTSVPTRSQSGAKFAFRIQVFLFLFFYQNPGFDPSHRHRLVFTGFFAIFVRHRPKRCYG
jgi:hypothetical protein